MSKRHLFSLWFIIGFMGFYSHVCFSDTPNSTCNWNAESYEKAFKTLPPRFNSNYPPAKKTLYQEHISQPINPLADCLTSTQRLSLYSSAFEHALDVHSLEAAKMVNILFRYTDVPESLTSKKIKSYHRLMIAYRMFNDALNVREDYPELAIKNPAPIKNARSLGNVSSYLTYNPNSKKLVHKKFDVENYTGVVVIGFAGCGFSRAATHAISESSSLSKVMKNQSLWLANSWTVMDKNSLQAISEMDERIPLAIVWQESDWPDIHYWGTPSFYFYREGKLITTQIGWPRGKDKESLDKLARNLNKIGL